MTYDNVANCKKVKCPTLVIHNRQDELIPYEMGRKLYETLPVADKEFLDTAGGHGMGWMESYAAYANGLK
jgi:hypothetical protein